MNPSLKSLLRAVPIFIILLFVHTQSGYAQSLRDSLIDLNKYFYENTKNEDLKRVLTDIQASYKSDLIDDSLAAHFIKAERILIIYSEQDREKILSYAKMLERLLKPISSISETYYASSLNNLGTMYLRKGLTDKALLLYQQSLAIKKRVLGEEHPETAIILDNLSLIYQQKREFEKALTSYQEALVIKKKTSGEESLAYANTLQGMSFVYSGMNKKQQALAFMEQALAIKRKITGEETHEYAATLYNLGKLFLTMGKYGEALTTFLKNAEIGKKVWGDKHYLYANVVNSIGTAYEDMGMYDKALPFVQQAIEIRKRVLGVEHAGYFDSLEQLADIYMNLGQFQKAMPLIQETLVMRKKILGEESEPYAYSLINLAGMYENLGDYERALALTQQALRIVKKIYGEVSGIYISFLGNMAAIYINSGEYAKALPLQEEVLRLAQKAFGEEHPEYAVSLHSMAKLYILMDDCKKALPLLEQALSLTKKIQEEENSEQASLLASLADVYKCMKQVNKALSLYHQALSTYKNVLGERNLNYVACLNALGLMYALAGNPKDGSSLMKKACTVELDYLANTYSILTEQEKMKLLNKESYLFNYLPSLMVTKRMSDPDLIGQLYTNELALKGIVLEDQAQVLREARKSSDSSALQLYEQWQTNKNLMGKQLLQPAIERKLSQDSLEEVVIHLEQQISRQSLAFRNMLQTVTQKVIFRKLAKGEAAVEFFHFKLYNNKPTDSVLYAALVLLPGDSNVHLVHLFEEKQLQALLSPPSKKTNSYTLLEKLYPGKTKGVLLQDPLFMLIWKPLEKYLKGIRTVYYAPAGLLHRVSFNALKVDASYLLIDKYRLNQLLSTRSVAIRASIDPKPRSATLWGNIRYDLPTSSAITSRGNEPGQQHADTSTASFNFYTSSSRGSRGKEWRTLPGTAKEVDNIRTVLLNSGVETTIDSGIVATEEAFKLMDGNSPKVVHLATHSFFLPVPHVTSKGSYGPGEGDNAFTTQQNPMFRSGLVLAAGNHTWKGEAAIPGKEDGILTAYEIAQIDLSNTDLVVLSACETALGDIQGNEGVIGLQRAFKMAGVKQLIVSLWRVPDRETQELMTLFYRNWLAGRSTREALRMAQLKMKEKYAPYYWAAFVLVE